MPTKFGDTTLTVPRVFSTAGSHTRPGARVTARAPTGRVTLNDLFELFPELPQFRHRPLAEQLRRVRENVERVQRSAKRNVARHRAAAALVKASWLAKRRR